jgi:hypothetical protein
MAGNIYLNICSCSSSGWEYVNVLAEKNTETPPKKEPFLQGSLHLEWGLCQLRRAIFWYASHFRTRASAPISVKKEKALQINT